MKNNGLENFITFTLTEKYLRNKWLRKKVSVPIYYSEYFFSTDTNFQGKFICNVRICLREKCGTVRMV